MKEAGIFLFIFGFIVLLCGIYLFTGHKNELLLWKVHDIKNFTIEQTKNVGKWTIISSLIIMIISIILYVI